MKRAIRTAAAHIRAVARRQIPRAWTISPTPGLRITQRVTPLDRVGCYVPGGRYPLPSSLLMTAIPAVTAGVGEVFAVCPRPDPTVMFAALEAGVSRLFRIGGAHAVAALAYGTASIPRVDKIVGPGNAYVAAAKAQVAADCAIDFFAGPSEIAVVSTTGNPAWIAADLIAQAEHDPDARAILITPARSLALAVAREIEQQLPSDRPGRDGAQRNGGIIVTATLDEAIALSQRLAPEHVVCDTDAVAQRLTRAGHGLRRPAERAGVRRLRDRVQPRAADERRGLGPRRPERGGLRPRVVGAADRPRNAAWQRESGLRRGRRCAGAEGLWLPHAASVRTPPGTPGRRGRDEPPVRAAAGAGRRAPPPPQREHRRVFAGGAAGAQQPDPRAGRLLPRLRRRDRREPPRTSASPATTSS